MKNFLSIFVLLSVFFPNDLFSSKRMSEDSCEIFTDGRQQIESAFEETLKSYMLAKKNFQKYWGVVSANYADMEDNVIENTIYLIMRSRNTFEYIEDSYSKKPVICSYRLNKLSAGKISEIILFLHEKAMYYNDFSDLLFKSGVIQNKTQQIFLSDEDKSSLSKQRYAYLYDKLKKYSVIRSFLTQKLKGKAHKQKIKLTSHEIDLGYKNPLSIIKDLFANAEFDAMQEKGIAFLECLNKEKHDHVKPCVKGRCLLDKFPKLNPSHMIVFAKIIEERIEMLTKAFPGEFESALDKFDIALKSAYLEAKRKDEEIFRDVLSMGSGSGKKKKAKKTTTKKAAEKKSEEQRDASAKKIQISSESLSLPSAKPSVEVNPFIAPSRKLTKKEAKRFEEEAQKIEKKAKKKVSQETSSSGASSTFTSSSVSSSSSSFTTSSSSNTPTNVLGSLKKKIETYADAAKAVLSPEQSAQAFFRRSPHFFAIYTQTKRLQQDTEKKLIETQENLDQERQKTKALEDELASLRAEQEALQERTERSQKTSERLMVDLCSLQDLFVGKSMEGDELRRYTEAVLVHASQMQNVFRLQQQDLYWILSANQGLYQNLQDVMHENAQLKARISELEGE